MGTQVSAFEAFAVPPSLRDVLRWFERSRTDSLGGPQCLGELQSRSGILVVVARLQEIVYDIATAQRLGAADTGIAYEVRSSVQLRRRNTQVLFDERLHVGASGPCIARVVVTCLCVNSSAMKLCACPPEVAAQLLAWGR